jgi:hypothetical protein
MRSVRLAIFSYIANWLLQELNWDITHSQWDSIEPKLTLPTELAKGRERRKYGY